MILTDVTYILEATSPDGSTAHLLKERPRAHLGLTDFKASVRLLAPAEHVHSAYSGAGHADLGWMIYDTASAKSQFFRAVMVSGVLDLTPSSNLMLAR